MLNVEQNPVRPQRQFRRSGKKAVCNSRGSAHFIRRLIHRLAESLPVIDLPPAQPSRCKCWCEVAAGMRETD
jgi:hypothetical protein